MSNKLKKCISYTLRMVVLALFIIWSAFPIFILVISSFKPSRDIFDFPPSIFFKPSLINYFNLVERWPEFFGKLLNSAIITLGATSLTIVITTMAGYVYARHRNMFLTYSAFFMIVIRMVPPIVITIPLFPALNYFALNDTHILLILLYSTFFVSLCTWIMKAFIDQIPKDIEEAAFIDGASLFQTLTRVTLPLAVHGIIASAVFVFIFSWNEFLFAFLFTANTAKTAPIILSEMQNSVTGVEWGPLFAAATLQVMPILVFVILVQRYLITGIAAGSTKG
jgi:multiple sugar transport system permease protein